MLPVPRRVINSPGKEHVVRLVSARAALTLVPLGTPRAIVAKFMAGKCALHIAKAIEATPRAEDSCQFLIRSGTICISFIIQSMSVVRALFKDSDSAMPRQASKRSSMEFRASS
jgi:hypothetical protein